MSLPPSAQVWSAFVAGQAVRPTTRDGKVRLAAKVTAPVRALGKMLLQNPWRQHTC